MQEFFQVSHNTSVKEVNGRTWINCETVGDQDDPMTAKRQAIFEPVGKEIAVQMESIETILGKSVVDGRPLPPPPTEKVLVESRMIQCVQCGALVAMVIFADDAKAPDRLEDYARLIRSACVSELSEPFKGEPADMGH